MKGIILFADNNVLEAGTFENNLFNQLKKSTNDYVILPICSVEELEETLKNVSTFKALILDWNFEIDSIDKDEEAELGLELPIVTPEELLLNNEIYSLVYIYSQNKIPSDIEGKLKTKFGQKVSFKSKDFGNDVVSDASSILQDVQEFENTNKHMGIPLLWSQAINKSVQEIFVELEHADPNWIKEIRDTAQNDGGDSTSEVIEIFHHILNESLIQDKELREALNNYDSNKETTSEEYTAKLYRRILYSKIHNDTPIMTGDIFKFSENEYGILITPECEVMRRLSDSLEFLIFNQNSFNSFLMSAKSYNRGIDEYTPRRAKSLNNIFNNEDISKHILPSFPFNPNVFNESAVIDFKTAFVIRNNNEFSKKRTEYKLNAPYIHQLRQRYVAFFGKYGVPSIPDSVRGHNLK